MHLHFKETPEIVPTLWFRLYVGSMPTDIFYPPSIVIDFLTTDFPTQYGIDVEAEANNDMVEKLIKEFDYHGPIFGGIFTRRTRLEMALAVDEITPRLLARIKSFNL